MVGKHRIELASGNYSLVRANEFIQIKGFDGVIIAAHCHSCQQACLIYVDNVSSQDNQRRVQDYIRHCSENLKKNSCQNVVFKYLVSASEENRLKDILKREKIKFRGKSYLKNLFIEVVFLGEDGSLKVAGLPALDKTVLQEDSIKVLIVDDSMTIRKILRTAIEGMSGFTVVAEAERPSQVRDLIIQHKPHVMTLDINMPEMTGVELIEELFKEHFVPTIVVSSLNLDDGPLVIQALELGAVDYLHKPTFSELATLRPLLEEKLRVVAQSTKNPRREGTAIGRDPSRRKSVNNRQALEASLIGIGASTGGTEAIKEVLLGLPDHVPPILIVQHIPANFSKAFADRLNELCPFHVKEAADGDLVETDKVLVAGGGKQMEVVRRGSRMEVRVYDGEPVNGHRPSVDVLFRSMAKMAKRKALIGVILTGMGRDGAKGILALREAGALTIGQDQETCVVYGMPKAAVQLGGVTTELPLGDISGRIVTEWEEEIK